MRFLLTWLRAYDLFGSDDRAGGALPAELEGKSPLEVAQYYQNRERNMRTQDVPPGTNPPPPPPVSREDFDSDPLAAAQRLITQNSVSREEFQALTQQARAGLVGAAKMTAMQGKKYWTRLLPEMEQIAQGSTDPIAATNPEWWTTTYNYLVGKNLLTLQSEEAEAAAAAARRATDRKSVV